MGAPGWGGGEGELCGVLRHKPQRDSVRVVVRVLGGLGGRGGGGTRSEAKQSAGTRSVPRTLRSESGVLASRRRAFHGLGEPKASLSLPLASRRRAFGAWASRRRAFQLWHEAKLGRGHCEAIRSPSVAECAVGQNTLSPVQNRGYIPLALCMYA